jgi:hypothetical protein
VQPPACLEQVPVAASATSSRAAESDLQVTMKGPPRFFAANEDFSIDIKKKCAGSHHIGGGRTKPWPQLQLLPPTAPPPKQPLALQVPLLLPPPPPLPGAVLPPVLVLLAVLLLGERLPLAPPVLPVSSQAAQAPASVGGRAVTVLDDPLVVLGLGRGTWREGGRVRRGTHI